MLNLEREREIVVLCAFVVVVVGTGVWVVVVVCVVQMIHGTASLSWRVRKMHLIKSATEQLQG